MGPNGSTVVTPTTTTTYTFTLGNGETRTLTIDVAGIGDPVAAHTFTSVPSRIYLSRRAPGPPGAGGWTDPITLFDGSLNPSFVSATTFSAGALTTNPIENRGILSLVNLTDLAFLGNGIPDVPKLISYPGQVGSITSLDYWDMSQGAWTVGNAQYVLIKNNSKIRVLKTINAGTSWSEITDANAPTEDANIGAVQRINNKLYLFMPAPSSTFAIFCLDMLLDAWEPSVASVSDSQISGFGVNRWSNGLCRFPNGDFGVVYDDHIEGPVYRLFSAGAWGSVVPIPSVDGSFANMVIDPGLELLHVWTYIGFNDRTSGMIYSIVAHDGTLTPSIFTFPSRNGSDGAGHPSIQDRMIFLPYDNFDLNVNSVWVAYLSNGQFIEEPLPHPADQPDISPPTCAYMMSGYTLGGRWRVREA